MEDGAGIPGAFPALKGSGVVNGDINAQTNLILNGRNAMPAFGKQLSANELAAVITYTRNALGNSKGDEIQAKDIKTLLDGGKVEAKSEKPAASQSTPVVKVDKAEVEKNAAKPEENHQVQWQKTKSTKPDEVKIDNAQFAQDKFYPQKKYTDKPPANDAQKQSVGGASDSKKNIASTAKVGLDELTKKGEAVYQKNCQSCHQKDGAGMPPTFPALKGSPVAKGDINKQVDLLLKGKGMMPAFGKTLSAEDFAAVLAFTRNSLGNSAGDYKEPADIEKLQAGL